MTGETIYERGHQPCNNLLRGDADIAALGEGNRSNVHDCPICGRTRTWCENCHMDHHEDGWETCRKVHLDRDTLRMMRAHVEACKSYDRKVAAGDAELLLNEIDHLNSWANDFCAAQLKERAAGVELLKSLRRELRIILPMAKAHAQAHPIGNNAAMIESAERAALANWLRNESVTASITHNDGLSASRGEIADRVEALQSEATRLRDALTAIRDWMDERYDGAPDAGFVRHLWEPMEIANAALGRMKGK